MKQSGWGRCGRGWGFHRRNTVPNGVWHSLFGRGFFDRERLRRLEREREAAVRSSGFDRRGGRAQPSLSLELVLPLTLFALLALLLDAQLALLLFLLHALSLLSALFFLAISLHLFLLLSFFLLSSLP